MHMDFGGHDTLDTGNILYGIPFSVVDSNPVKGQQFPPGPTLWDEDNYDGEIDEDAGELLRGSHDVKAPMPTIPL